MHFPKHATTTTATTVQKSKLSPHPDGALSANARASTPGSGAKLRFCRKHDEGFRCHVPMSTADSGQTGVLLDKSLNEAVAAEGRRARWMAWGWIEEAQTRAGHRRIQ
jgi:hypothetical protein